MPDIAEHDPEHDHERDRGERRRVDIRVGHDAVRGHQGTERAVSPAWSQTASADRPSSAAAARRLRRRRGPTDRRDRRAAPSAPSRRAPRSSPAIVPSPPGAAARPPRPGALARRPAPGRRRRPGSSSGGPAAARSPDVLLDTPQRLQRLTGRGRQRTDQFDRPGLGDQQQRVAQTRLRGDDCDPAHLHRQEQLRRGHRTRLALRGSKTGSPLQGQQTRGPRRPPATPPRRRPRPGLRAMPAPATRRPTSPGATTSPQLATAPSCSATASTAHDARGGSAAANASRVEACTQRRPSSPAKRSTGRSSADSPLMNRSRATSNASAPAAHALASGAARAIRRAHARRRPRWIACGVAPPGSPQADRRSADRTSSTPCAAATPGHAEINDPSANGLARGAPLRYARRSSTLTSSNHAARLRISSPAPGGRASPTATGARPAGTSQPHGPPTRDRW